MKRHHAKGNKNSFSFRYKNKLISKIVEMYGPGARANINYNILNSDSTVDRYVDKRYREREITYVYID